MGAIQLCNFLRSWIFFNTFKIFCKLHFFMLLDYILLWKKILCKLHLSHTSKASSANCISLCFWIIYYFEKNSMQTSLIPHIQSELSNTSKLKVLKIWYCSKPQQHGFGCPDDFSYFWSVKSTYICIQNWIPPPPSAVPLPLDKGGSLCSSAKPLLNHATIAWFSLYNKKKKTFRFSFLV